MSERRRLFRNEAFDRRGRSEPIDGLLRITAPHEWLFLTMLGCALFGVLLWAVFGTIERGLSGPCALTSPPVGERFAVVRLSTDDARRVAVGMSARVRTNGAGEPLNGQVAEVVLTPDGSDDLRPLVRVSLPDAPTEVWRNGDTCDLRIVTSREAPIRMLFAMSAATPRGLK